MTTAKTIAANDQPTNTTRTWCFAACLMVLAVVLTGCGGAGGGGGGTTSTEPPNTPDPDDPPPVVDTTLPRLVVSSLTITGETSDMAEVTVNGVDDSDGQVDTNWAVTLVADGDEFANQSAANTIRDSIFIEAVSPITAARDRVRYDIEIISNN